MNEVLKAIHERRSIRSYEARQVSDAELDAVLDAGRWAPSAMNRQPVKIVAVTNKEYRDTVSRLNAAVMGSSNDPFYGAPCIIIVLCQRSAATGREDATLALSNMMLAAHSIGLGSCWINREKEIFDSQEGKDLLAKWGLDDSWMGVGALALGYIKGEVPASKGRRDDVILKVR